MTALESWSLFLFYPPSCLWSETPLSQYYRCVLWKDIRHPERSISLTLLWLSEKQLFLHPCHPQVHWWMYLCSPVLSDTLWEIKGECGVTSLNKYLQFLFFFKTDKGQIEYGTDSNNGDYTQRRCWCCWLLCFDCWEHLIVQLHLILKCHK